MCELNEHGKQFIVCKGGNGGVGNKVNTKKNKPGEVNLKSGRFGEEKEVELELKCISDVCLVGFPNAGKSTLMAAVSIFIINFLSWFQKIKNS